MSKNINLNSMQSYPYPPSGSNVGITATNNTSTAFSMPQGSTLGNSNLNNLKAKKDLTDVLHVELEVSRQLVNSMNEPNFLKTIGEQLEVRMRNEVDAYVVKLMRGFQIDPDVLSNQKDLIARQQAELQRLRYKIAMILDDPNADLEYVLEMLKETINRRN